MDPTEKSRILSRLKRIYADLPPRKKQAAKYIVDFPADFGLDPIRITAQKAGVSAYTFVRLAQRLGFEGFEEMRSPFRIALLANPPPAGDTLLDTEHEHALAPEAQALMTANHNALAQLRYTQRRLSYAQLSRVIDMLFSAQTVFVTGMRASYSLAYYLHYVGRMALPNMQLVPGQMNSPIDDLNTATEDDLLVAVTFTPYSRETVDACRFATQRGMSVVIITDTEVLGPELGADEAIIATSVSTHYFACYSAGMAAIESLLALMLAEGGEDADARIRSYEDVRRANNAYWQQQKKH